MNSKSTVDLAKALELQKKQMELLELELKKQQLEESKIDPALKAAEEAQAKAARTIEFIKNKSEYKDFDPAIKERLALLLKDFFTLSILITKESDSLEGMWMAPSKAYHTQLVKELEQSFGSMAFNLFELCGMQGWEDHNKEALGVLVSDSKKRKKTYNDNDDSIPSDVCTCKGNPTCAKRCPCKKAGRPCQKACRCTSVDCFNDLGHQLRPSNYRVPVQNYAGKLFVFSLGSNTFISGMEPTLEIPKSSRIIRDATYQPGDSL